MSQLRVAYKVELEESNGVNSCSQSVCSWSRRNEIALTVPSIGTSSKGSHDVCIVDPNRPWHRLRFSSGHSHRIQFIKWDVFGSRFFTVDASGCCRIWQKDVASSQWSAYHTFRSINEDEIIYAAWVGHELDSVSESMSKKVLISKGISKKDTKPCITNVGGQRESAILLITSTGYIHVIIATQPCVAIGSCLGITRFRTVLAGATFTELGKILVAVTNASNEIEVFALTISFNCPTYTIHTEYYPCLEPFLPTDPPNCQIDGIAFPLVGNVENLIVTISSSSPTTQNFIRRYELRKEQLVLHPQLKRSTDQVASVMQQTWRCLVSEATASPSRILCLQRFPALTGQPGHPVDPQEAFLPTMLSSNGDKMILELDPVSLLTKSSFVMPLDDDERVVSLAAAPSDVCSVAVTSKGYFMVLLRNCVEELSDRGKAHMLSDMLLNCVACVISPWEVALLTSYHGNLVAELCIQMMNDAFSDKHVLLKVPSFTQFAVKAYLYTAMGNGYYGANICYNGIRLVAIHQYVSSAFESVASDKDASVMAVIRNLCSRPAENDVRKLSKGFDARDVMTSLEGCAQLQNFLHWSVEFCADLSRLFLSATVPPSHLALIMSGLQPDVIPLLRELLLLHFVLVQGSIFAQQLFLPSVPFEYVPSMFRFLTKLKAFNISDGGSELASLEDVPLRSMHAIHYSPMLHEPSYGILGRDNNLSQKFETYTMDTADTSPEDPASVLMFSSRDPLMSGRIVANTKKTNIYDGINCCYLSVTTNDTIRKCNRCLCTTLLPAANVKNSGSQWQTRWMATCVCHGNWRHITCSSE